MNQNFEEMNLIFTIRDISNYNPETEEGAYTEDMDIVVVIYGNNEYEIYKNSIEYIFTEVLMKQQELIKIKIIKNKK